MLRQHSQGLWDIRTLEEYQTRLALEASGIPRVQRGVMIYQVYGSGEDGEVKLVGETNGARAIVDKVTGFGWVIEE